jgi:hypothetical protein
VLRRAGNPVRACTSPKISAKASRQRKKTRFLSPNGLGVTIRKTLACRLWPKAVRLRFFSLLNPDPFVLRRAGKPVRAYTGPKISAKASRQRKKTRFLSPNGLGVTIRKT